LRIQRVVLLCAALAACSCSPSLPRPFSEARAAAERAYAHGRYDEAAAHWQKAERTAAKKRDRLEARYRRAASLRRAGRFVEAKRAYDSLLESDPRSERAARAAFDRAEVEIEHGDAVRGHARLAWALRTYPGSGLAPIALKRQLFWIEEREGLQSALVYLERLARSVRRSELEERVLYARAKLLDKAGRRHEAHAQYLMVADRFAYPRGSLWDDSLFNASRLADAMGQPRTALAHLERMLAEQEPSHLAGIYERPRYAEARWRIAELYRDRLHDPGRARRAFHQVFTEHETTLLRDDALFNEALLARQMGDLPGACSVLRLLAKEQPDSRFVACSTKVCPSLPSKGSRPCPNYIQRRLTGPQPTLDQIVH